MNIKVDREERPDVDRVYMTFVQATTGGGGWPMSVWLTPNLKPFVGGTYFPPEDRYGQPGFTKVLKRIARAWKEEHEKIAEQGDEDHRSACAKLRRQRRVDGEDRHRNSEAAYEQFARSLRRERRRLRRRAEISAAGYVEFSHRAFTRAIRRATAAKPRWK